MPQKNVLANRVKSSERFLAGNCSFREDCVLKAWSEWSGNVPNGGCAVQIRTRDFNKSIEWIERETCDGLESCPAIREDTRTTCKWRPVLYSGAGEILM